MAVFTIEQSATQNKFGLNQSWERAMAIRFSFLFQDLMLKQGGRIASLLEHKWYNSVMLNAETCDISATVALPMLKTNQSSCRKSKKLSS